MQDPRTRLILRSTGALVATLAAVWFIAPYLIDQTPPVVETVTVTTVTTVTPSSTPVLPAPVPHDLPAPVAAARDLERFRQELAGIDLSPIVLDAEMLLRTPSTEPAPAPVFPDPFPAETYYPPETVEAVLEVFFYTEAGLIWARRVGNCESNFRLDALGALGEIGWFQHRPEFWPERSRLAGYPGGDPWDPQINTAVAAWMFYSPAYGPGHWSCK